MISIFSKIFSKFRGPLPPSGRLWSGAWESDVL